MNPSGFYVDPFSHTNDCFANRQKNGCHFPCRETIISNLCRSIEIMWERQPCTFVNKQTSTYLQYGHKKSPLTYEH